MAGKSSIRIAPAAIGAALALAAGSIGAAQAPAGAAVRDGDGPNVIVVMSDDEAPGMLRALPHVRRELGARGTSFSNAIVTYPLCCPARATLLTGQYAHNHGTMGNNSSSAGGYRALLDPRRTLAAWLQAGGYETAFAGKWLNGLRTPHRAPPGWDRWWGLVGEGGEGLSSYYDFDVFEPGSPARHFGDSDADYQTDVITRDYALPYIRGQASQPGPFFLWLSYHPPHFGLGRDDPAGRRCSEGPPDDRSGKQSAIPPRRYARRYLRARAPRPPSFDERDVADKPRQVRRRPRLTRDDLAEIDRDHRCGLGALRALDDGVGAIVDELRATGQLDQTVLVYLPDHGVMAGEHRLARGKNVPYEEAIRVPLMVRGPGVVRGGVVDAPVANVDLAPTILALAGVTVPTDLARPIDGISLAPQLAGATPDPRRVVGIEGRANVERARHGYKVRSYVGARSARYAYVEYRRASFDARAQGAAAPIGGGRTTDRELYDLSRDPYELRNRARDPGYAGVRRQLASLTARLRRCAGAACTLDARIPGPAG